jgi:hypothetical protein
MEGHHRLGNAAVLAAVSGAIENNLANVRIHQEEPCVRR